MIKHNRYLNISMKLKMRNNIFSVSTLSLLLIIFLCWSCREKKTAESSEPTRIEWTKKAWNFGNLTAGEEVCHTFIFKNTGQHNLLIKNIETGCGCTTVNYDKAPVPPGKEGKIEIAFNSEGRYGKQYKEIRIFANIPEKSTTLTFTANVK